MVCSTPALSYYAFDCPTCVTEVRKPADDHVVFGGRLDLRDLSVLERLLVKAVHALPGDHRNWGAVDDWSHVIAEELHDAGSRSLRATSNHEPTTH